MKKFSICMALGIGLLGIGAADAAGMKLTSAEIKNGATIANDQVFKGFGCTGNNISPSLSWSGARAAPRASPSPSTIRMPRPAVAGGIGSYSIFRWLRPLWPRELATRPRI